MPHPDPTVFDAILAGDLPCHRVLEDEHVLAFLDIQPLSHGHVLVIPKQRAAQLLEGAPLTPDADGELVARGAEHSASKASLARHPRQWPSHWHLTTQS